MQLITQIFTISLSLALFVYILSSVRKSLIGYKYALFWILLDFAVLFFSAFPKTLEFFASLLGIGVPLNLLMFLGIILSLILTFALSVSLNKLTLKLFSLIQQNAILCKTVDDLSDRINEIQENRNNL